MLRPAGPIACGHDGRPARSPAARAPGAGPVRSATTPTARRVDVLAEGLHPADDAVPRQVRLLHVRPAAGPARVARTSRPTQVLAIARAGAAAGCHEALFTLGERPEVRYPVARDWLDEHGYASTVDYLAAMAELVLDETGLLPHANAGALYADELAALRAGRAEPGDDARVAARRPRLPPRLARQDARAPAGHARGRGRARRSRSPPASSSASARPRADRIDALEAIAASHRAPRPRAGGHRPELPAQAGHGDARRAAVPARRVPRGRSPLARVILPPEIHLQAPPNLSDDFGVLLDAGIDDWGGVSPVTADHVNPERPWPALDRLREVTEAQGLRARAAAHDLPRVRARSRALARRRRCASRCSTVSDAEGLGRDDPGAVFPQSVGEFARTSATAPRSCSSAPLDRLVLGRRRRTRRCCVPGARRGAGGRGRARCSTACGSARSPAIDELVTLFSRPRPRGRRRRRARRRAAPRDRRRRRHVRAQPQHQLHERVHVQVPVLRVLEGPAVAEPARHAVPAHARRHRRSASPRQRRLRRHRGVPAGRHPPRLRRRLLHRRQPGGEGGGARHPRARLHRARGHRGRAAARRAARPTTCAA